MALGFLLFGTIAIPFELRTALAVDFSTAIIEVAKKNLPTVVYVEVTKTQEVAILREISKADEEAGRFSDGGTGKIN